MRAVRGQTIFCSSPQAASALTAGAVSCAMPVQDGLAAELVTGTVCAKRTQMLATCMGRKVKGDPGLGLRALMLLSGRRSAVRQAKRDYN